MLPGKSSDTSIVPPRERVSLVILMSPVDFALRDPSILIVPLPDKIIFPFCCSALFAINEPGILIALDKIFLAVPTSNSIVFPFVEPL